MAFKLPDLQGRLPIVDAMGRPVSSFLRYFNIDFKGAIEKQEAAQAEILAELQAVQATQQDEIDRLNRVLAGTEPFSAVNVDGVIVAENAGLSEGIVSTEAIALEAVNVLSSDFDSTLIDINNSTPVEVQTITVTLDTDQYVEVSGSFTFRSQGNAVGTPTSLASIARIAIYRDGVLKTDVAAHTALYGMTLFTPGIAYLIESPGAGTYTYTVRGRVDNPANVTVCNAADRYISAKVFKR